MYAPTTATEHQVEDSSTQLLSQSHMQWSCVQSWGPLTVTVDCHSVDMAHHDFRCWPTRFLWMWSSRSYCIALEPVSSSSSMWKRLYNLMLTQTQQGLKLWVSHICRLSCFFPLNIELPEWEEKEKQEFGEVLDKTCSGFRVCYCCLLYLCYVLDCFACQNIMTIRSDPSEPSATSINTITFQNQFFS